jgi:hypothetical protein
VTSFFFTFLKNYLNGLSAPFVYVGFVPDGLLAGFVLDHGFRRPITENRSGGRSLPGHLAYIILGTPPPRRDLRPAAFLPWLIICVLRYVA